jgi:hypothetical protein
VAAGAISFVDFGSVRYGCVFDFLSVWSIESGYGASTVARCTGKTSLHWLDVYRRNAVLRKPSRR